MGSVLMAAAPPPLPAAVADPALLAAIVRDSGVQVEIAKPGWAEYLPVLLTAILRRAWEGMRPLRSLLDVTSGVAGILAIVFVVLVLLALVVLAVRLVARRRRGTVAPRGGGVVVEAVRPSAVAAAEWRRELEARLEAGDAAGALEALWWFLARSVASEDAHPSWTSGELLARARRQELRPFAVQLDRFRYGPRAAETAQVRDLAVRLERALA